jgi:hypothetical protein
MTTFDFVYRDTTLAEHLIKRYQREQHLLEISSLFTSRLQGCLTTNLRYLIAIHPKTRKIINLYLPSKADEWGLVILKPGSNYQVLNIDEVKGKTQILLLLEEDDAEMKPDSVEKQKLIDIARKDFDKSLTLPPLPQLQTDEWRAHTEFPIGIDADGNLIRDQW